MDTIMSIITSIVVISIFLRLFEFDQCIMDGFNELFSQNFTYKVYWFIAAIVIVLLLVIGLFDSVFHFIK